MSLSCRGGTLLGSALLISFLFATLLVLFVEHDASVPGIQLKAADLQLCLTDEDNGDKAAGAGVDSSVSLDLPVSELIGIPDAVPVNETRLSATPWPLTRPEARAPPLRF